MIRRPPRSTLDRSSAASDVYKRQPNTQCNKILNAHIEFFTTSFKQVLSKVVGMLNIELVAISLRLRKHRIPREVKELRAAVQRFKVPFDLPYNFCGEVVHRGNAEEIAQLAEGDV
eukprot:TRINITY_DN1884_c0_g1_i7.p2 TRINITY_DN1884_c0_g1~~TRINITY_DN1884_c0_g1_i7.p2  ORF type:complete len:123 (+),score=21.12 TRINITY_DN1884_c0_g1_i7:24-371(+)